MKQLLVALLFTLPAYADVSGVDIRIQLTDKTKIHHLTDQELRKQFNRAHCVCETLIGVELLQQGTQTGLNLDQEVQLWVGPQCDDLQNRTQRDLRCERLATTTLGQIRVAQVFDATVKQITSPKSDECSSVEGDQTIWVLVDETLTDTKVDKPFQLAVKTDLKAPTLPADIVAVSSEDGFRVTWKLQTTSSSVAKFQLLCAKSDGTPSFTKNLIAPDYNSSFQTCGIGDPVLVASPTTESLDAGSPDAPVFDAAPAVDASADAGISVDASSDADPADASSDAGGTSAFPAAWQAALDRADKAYVCSSSVGGNQSELIADLSNTDVKLDGTQSFFVALVAIDDHENPVITPLADLVSPKPVVDFWETYRAQGGSTKGGACAVSNRRTPLGILWFLPLAFLFLRRKTPLALALLALVAFALPAGAQEEVEAESIDPPRSEWNLELKLGPYLPDVDGENGLTGKPYETLFGDGGALLGQIELDRFFLWPLGQLGLAGSAGYFSDSGKAFQQGADGKPTTERATDDTRFRMIPLSLALVYRFTALADHTFVPLIPYAKVGLRYDLWWSTKDDGSVSRSDDESARGGTLGTLATIGVSMRIDFLDPGAAHDLRTEYGVEHPGFFVEAARAEVSGLGVANRMHTGDTTWAAGVNFEF